MTRISKITSLALLLTMAGLTFGQEPPVPDPASRKIVAKQTKISIDTESLDLGLQEVISGKRDPKSLEELRLLQKHVKELVKKVTPATVGVRVGQSAGSGVIVTSDGYIMTAGHVSQKPNQKKDVWAILPGGKYVRAKTLGVDHKADSGLMKIVDDGPWPYLDLGKSNDLNRGQWIIGLGHPGGFEPGRDPVLRLGRVISHNASTIRTDCVLVGGDSGGPLIDLDGKVIGIHSRINNAVNSNIHVPSQIYSKTWAELVKSYDLSASPWIGFKIDPTAGLVVRSVAGPAKEAGMQAGDRIIKFDDRNISSNESLKNAAMGVRVEQKIVITVVRQGKEIPIEIKVGRRR